MKGVLTNKRDSATGAPMNVALVPASFRHLRERAFTSAVRMAMGSPSVLQTQGRTCVRSASATAPGRQTSLDECATGSAGSARDNVESERHGLELTHVPCHATMGSFVSGPWV